MLGDVNKPFAFKTLLITNNNVLPLHLKQTFLSIISIFTEGEGDGFGSRLPFKIFSTLTPNEKSYRLNIHHQIYWKILKQFQINFIKEENLVKVTNFSFVFSMTVKIEKTQS